MRLLLLLFALLPSTVALAQAPGSAAPALRSSIGLSGSHGPLRVAAANAPDPFSVGTGLVFEFMTASDLIVTGDDNTRIIGTLAIDVVPTDFVELFLTLGSRANKNTAGDPQLIQSLGETTFGIKAFYPSTPFLSVGGLARVGLVSGQGDLGWGSANVGIHGLATLDARAIDPDAIVRAHLNLGYTFENGHDLVMVDGVAQTLTPVAQFAANITEFDMFDVALAVEVLPAVVTPFVEWGIRVPLGTRVDTSEVCVEEQTCPADAGFASFPQRLTLGLTGEAIPGLTLRAAVDLGLTSSISTGIPAMPTYNVIFGLAYAAGAASERPVLINEAAVARQRARPEGRIRGRVVDAATRRPLTGATVRYPKKKMTAQLVGNNGMFLSYHFEPGPVRVEVTAPGYRKGAFQIPVRKGTVDFSFPLQPAVGGAAPRPPVATPPAATPPPARPVTRPPSVPPPSPPPSKPAFDPLAPGGG